MASRVNHEEMIQQFMEMTSCTPERARFYLESHAWDLGPAVETFFEADNALDQDVTMEDFQPRHGATGPAAPAGGGGLFDLARQAAGYILPGLNPAVPPAGPSRTPETGSPRAQKKKPTAPPSSGSSRIATLGSIRGRDESSDDSDDDGQKKHGQEFYVGSGQEVIGPGTKKRNPDEIISSVFKSARQHGAEQVEDEPHQHNRPQVFSGAGVRLDAAAPTGVNSAPLPTASGSQTSAANAGRSSVVTLRMWRNGFTVNDGPLRLYTDPANQEFMEYIKQGRVPRELFVEAKGGDLKVQMEDHRDQEYTQPKRPAEYFGGTGHMLGSPAPAVMTSKIEPPKKAESGDDRKASEEKAKTAFTPDAATPTTNIQIRLSDGSRLVHRFNESHTVGDVRRFIRLARPEYDGRDFEMLSGYPSKPLTADNSSLKDANLLNAAIQLK